MLNMYEVIKNLSKNLIVNLDIDCNKIILNQNIINNFSSILEKNNSLQFLTINNINNKNLDYTLFFKALYYHNLKVLKINGSFPEIINLLIDLLNVNKSIETVILYFVEITDIKSFIKILDNNIIKSLILRRNNIKNITPIAETLKTNTSLVELCIGSNNITYINPLVEALKINKTLKILWLDNNKISILDDFIQLLKLNGPLQFINIYCNKTRNTQLLLRLLVDNKILKYFNYLDNSISKDGLKILNEIYKENNIIKI